MWLQALFLIVFTGLSEGSELRKLTSCICLGHELIFECDVVGDGGTYWQGTALQECYGGRILVRHSHFTNGRNTSLVCGTNGTVVARPILRVNNSYTTQIIISVNQQLNDSIIECTSDSGAVVGRSHIILSAATDPSTNTIALSDISHRHLTFKWSPVLANCPVAQNINATDCGHCSHTASNIVVCNTSYTVSVSCTISIQTITNVCGNRMEDVRKLTVQLKQVPPTPMVKVIDTSNYFPLIQTMFNETDPILLPDNFTVTVVSYSVAYSDAFSGNSCGSAKILASSCENRACSHIFEVFSQACQNSTYINVSVSATNLLGDGPPSNPVIVLINFNNEHGLPPSCQCFQRSSLFIGILSLLFVLLLSTTAAIILLIRSKIKIQKELKQCKESKIGAVYEEIQNFSECKTQANSAYDCVAD